MDPDISASTRDSRDDHRALLLVGAVAALIVAVIAIRPLRRALGSALSLAWRLGGGVAIVALIAERLGISRDELFVSVEEDELSDDEWEFPDETEPGDPPVRPKSRSTGATRRR
jgi:hypothetical protein